jgi:hypothetical protein
VEEYNIGKKAMCSRCCREKSIVFSLVGTEPREDICADCMEASNSCACDICDEEVRCDAYESHLLQEHSREQMARYISITQKDSKIP